MKKKFIINGGISKKNKIILLFLAFLCSLLSVGQIYIYKYIIDDSLLAKDINKLILIACINLVTICINAVVNLIMKNRIILHKEECSNNIRKKVLSRYFESNYTISKNITTGSIMTIFNEDIEKISDYKLLKYSSLISNILILIFIFLVMITTNVELTVLFLPAVLVYIAITCVCLTKAISSVDKAQKDTSKFKAITVESLKASDMIKTNNMHSYAQKRFDDFHKRMTNSMIKKSAFDVFVVQGGNYYIYVIQVIYLILAVLLIMYLDLKTSMGTLIVFSSYVIYLWLPIKSLVELYALRSTLKVNIERVGNILHLPIEGGNQHFKGSSPLGFKFDRLSFTYKDTKVLNNLSLDIIPGEKVAILGETGTGKTTLIRLLTRLEAPDTGTITTNNVEIPTLFPAEYRDHFSVQDQDHFFFNVSIRENLLCICPHAHESEIIDALSVVQLDKWIAHLEQGLDTIIGEDGISLSGGEIQRLNLARMLLHNGDVWILDEPTSALDEKTEKSVMQELMKRAEKKTVIIITHRLAILDFVDRIILLNKGRVESSGSHEDLIKEDCMYTAFYNSQLIGKEKSL